MTATSCLLTLSHGVDAKDTANLVKLDESSTRDHAPHFHDRQLLTSFVVRACQTKRHRFSHSAPISIGFRNDAGATHRLVSLDLQELQNQRTTFWYHRGPMSGYGESGSLFVENNSAHPLPPRALRVCAFRLDCGGPDTGDGRATSRANRSGTTPSAATVIEPTRRRSSGREATPGGVGMLQQFLPFGRAA